MGQVASAIASPMRKVFQDNMDKQMDFQSQSMQLGMERQLVMQNEMRERQMSMQLARAREIFKYYSVFYCCVVTAGVIGAIKKKNPTPLIPIVPLGFVCTFQYDAAYGNLMERVKEEAERILIEERSRLDVPNGMPTFQSVEAKRLSSK